MVARCLILACLFLLHLSHNAVAGAWPREEGSGFLQIQLRQDTTGPMQGTVGSAYLEYGLNDVFTLGGKLEHAVSLDTASTAMLFGRWHFPTEVLPLQIAAELAVEGNGDRLWITPTLHLGRGFDTALGPGWIDTTLSADVFLDGSPTAYTGFALLGVRPVDRLMTILALEALHQNQSDQLKLMPTAAWEIREGRHLTGSYTHVLEGAAADELSLGLWLEF